jgi:hypothetical protein
MAMGTRSWRSMAALAPSAMAFHRATQVTGSADLPTLLLHEIGHALGLEHDTMDVSAVMHERFEIGEARRALGSSDVQSVQVLYA